jgi:hypothetical protein
MLLEMIDLQVLVCGRLYFNAVLTKCYSYCKSERVIIVCSYDISNKSIEQI